MSVQYEQQCEQAMQNEVGDENSDKIFFDFLAKAYASFLAGTDGDSSQLEEDLAASFGATLLSCRSCCCRYVPALAQTHVIVRAHMHACQKYRVHINVCGVSTRIISNANEQTCIPMHTLWACVWLSIPGNVLHAT